MSMFPEVRNWRLPSSVLVDSYREMASDGVRGTEGIALWAGRRSDDGVVEVTHTILLRGPGVVRRPDLILIQPWLVNDVTDVLDELGAYLVGQIHSHGPGSHTDLSRTDVQHGIAVPYYLSAVAPDFGMRAVPRVNDWGVHLYEPRSGWRRLGRRETAKRICVEEDVVAPVIRVGEEQ